MANVVISQAAIDFVLNRKKIKRPNIVIYRAVSGIMLGYTTKPLRFLPKVKVMDKDPNELFVVVDNNQGMPIWVESGLLPPINTSDHVMINLRKGLLKGLKLELGSRLKGEP